MNIFYLDSNPKLCAQAHYDKHVVKMILESAQLLSTAHHVIDKNLTLETKNIIYAPTHFNHPSALWSRANSENYLWLVNLWQELMIEYTYRYDKHHACERLLPYLTLVPNGMINGSFTEPTPAMPDDFIISDSNLINYRYYYAKGKSHLYAYKRREPPVWLQEYNERDYSCRG